MYLAAVHACVRALGHKVPLVRSHPPFHHQPLHPLFLLSPSFSPLNHSFPDPHPCATVCHMLLHYTSITSWWIHRQRILLCSFAFRVSSRSAIGTIDARWTERPVKVRRAARACCRCLLTALLASLPRARARKKLTGSFLNPLPPNLVTTKQPCLLRNRKN
jgi:hypothetical protein